MKNRLKRVLVSSIVLSLLASSTVFGATHVVQSGDTFWKVSQRYTVKLDQLMKVNNATESTVLQIGQQITIPDGNNFYFYEVKSGDTLWLLSQRVGISFKGLLSFNGFTESTMLNIGQKVMIPIFEPTIQPVPQLAPIQPFVLTETTSTLTFNSHTVRSGDNFWNLSVQYDLPQQDLLKANNATSSTILFIGQTLRIPVVNVPVLPTPGPKFGEYMDWWKGAQYVVPIGAEFRVIDFATGRSFRAKRTIGANHADVETVTAADTETLRSIWGGNFSWTSRPAIIEYNGRRIAASVSGMPHAGNEAAPAGAWTSWRSDNYGAGPNYDYIKGNNMDGHFDIHFLNSTRHNDGRIDDRHQKNIKTSAGIEN